MTDRTDDARYQRMIAEYRLRLASIAAGMCRRADPMDVVAGLMGAAAGVLQGRGNDPDIASYLRVLADEFERRAEQEPTVGHA